MTGSHGRAMRIVAIALAIGCGGARRSSAAGEGFYCVGPDYLAYQFNGDGVHPGEHQLTVVNLADQAAASAPASIELDAFQTRGIRCLERAVELLGRSNVFVVALDEMRQPEPALPRAIVPHARPAAFDPPESLGASAAAFAGGALPARIMLDAPKAAKRFALEMRAAPHRAAADRAGAPCAIDAETRLLQLNAAGAAEKTRTIFRGLVTRHCAPSDFDGETADGTGAVLPAPACVAAPGRRAQQAIGEATEGADVTTPIGPFVLQLRSEGEDGWDLALLRARPARQPGAIDQPAARTLAARAVRLAISQ